MGCVPTKPLSMNSPPESLEKLKQKNGYTPRGGAGDGLVNPRRSTGQRFAQVDPAPRPIQRRDTSSGGSLGGSRIGGSGKGERPAGGSAGGDVFGLNGSEEEMVDGWPKWLVDNIPRRALKGLVPRSADSYDKIDKIGQGTYSNVYKARDRETGKLVALKKVRFDTSEPESVKFMAREIMILRELDHPNVVKLEGLATSRMQFSLYLVFDYMVCDLQRIITRPNGRLTESQIKCYMKQLLSGLQHCHEKGILHRDIKGSNLLIDKTGTLKIGDFGLANYYKPRDRRPLTNRVVTLWYRAPELLLGATDYGNGIDLWSAGCLLAEMFAGGPILPGRTEVEQLHRIFKLCGTPSEEYWKKMKLPTTFRPRQSNKSSLSVSFQEFPASSIGLLNSLLALDPLHRGTASSALNHEFFHSSPLACDLSGLPVVYKEENELTQTNEQRRRRRSKARRKSQAQRDRMKKDSAIENPTGEGQTKKEEQEEATQKIITQTSSNDLSANNPTTQLNRSPPSLPSLDASNKLFTVIPSDPRTPDSKNGPPLPGLMKSPTSSSIRYSTKVKDDMYRRNQVNRSASTRDFRKPNQRKYLERYLLED